MSSDEHIFLFASMESKRPLTARRVHIRRLYDILQLCIQRQDLERAKRTWGVLARCKEIDWKALWTMGLHILGGSSEESHKNELEYLRTIMLQYPEDRESVLRELVFRLLIAGKCREALDELELYLPSFPYQDNPVLHICAGLSSLYLAHTTSVNESLDRTLARDAQAHFEHAKDLDLDNTVAQEFLDKISALQNRRQVIQDDSDDEIMLRDDVEPNSKRSRT